MSFILKPTSAAPKVSPSGGPVSGWRSGLVSLFRNLVFIKFNCFLFWP